MDVLTDCRQFELSEECSLFRVRRYHRISENGGLRLSQGDMFLGIIDYWFDVTRYSETDLNTLFWIALMRSKNLNVDRTNCTDVNLNCLHFQAKIFELE